MYSSTFDFKDICFRYGVPASTLTDHTLSTVGNVYNIAQNAKVMTPKGFAKRTAKDTGKAVVYGYTASCRGRTAYEEMMANGTNSSHNDIDDDDYDKQVKSDKDASKN